MKTLSIIIVNYNTEEYLIRCLDSLYAPDNTLPNDWEIIIVDNGSKIIPSIESYKNLHLIKNKDNSGFSKANNLAIRQSTGEFVLLLNPDTIVGQETIVHMLNVMHTDKNICVATCAVTLPSGTLDDACHRGFPTPWNAFCHFSGLGNLFPNSLLFNGYHLGYKKLSKMHEIDACAGAFMLIRRSVGDRLHWLDEDYFWYGEDLDFCYRVKKAGYSIIYDPRVSIIHFKGIASGIKKSSLTFSTATNKIKKQSQKARIDAMRIFYSKHYLSQKNKLTTWLVYRGMDVLSWYFNHSV